MNQDRLKAIIESYGSHPKHWPDDERMAGQALLSEQAELNIELSSSLKSASNLDDLLETDPLPKLDYQTLNQSIMSRLPAERPSSTSHHSTAHWLDSIVNWLIPESINSLWQPTLAASLPIVLGLMIGLNSGVETLDSENFWTDEITVMALTDNALNDTVLTENISTENDIAGGLYD